MRLLPLDETLVWVAADQLWEWESERDPEVRRVRPPAHRSREFPFEIYEGSTGLMGSCMSWTTKRVSSTGKQLPPLPKCVCPDWMDCYCGGRD